MIPARWMVKIHVALLAVWAAMIPISFMLGWLEAVAFVSAASIYANMATHWAGYQAAHGEQRQDEDG